MTPPRLVLVPFEPTDEMLIAARDWSAAKYGKPIGNDAAIGCFRTMLSSAPEAPSEEMVERVARGIFERRHRGLKNCVSWEDLDDHHPGTRASYEFDARAALAALLAGPS